jgi:hypothetical protein
MRDAKLVQPPHEPAGSVEQVELILLAAVNVERLQPTEMPASVSIATTGSCRSQFAHRSSMISQVSNVTGSRWCPNLSRTFESR